MYCFSNICRMCSQKVTAKNIKLNDFDTDNVLMKTKLAVLFPEVNFDSKKPNAICEACRKFINKMITYKKRVLKTDKLLENYSAQLSNHNVSNRSWNLVVDVSEMSKNEINQMSVKPLTTHSNSWDFYEAKQICVCSGPNCKGCEAPVLGYTVSESKLKRAHEEVLNRIKNLDKNHVRTNLKKRPEVGFNPKDLALSRLHLKILQKKIKTLSTRKSPLKIVQLVQFKPEKRRKPVNLLPKATNLKLKTNRKPKLYAKRFFCHSCIKTYDSYFSLKKHQRSTIDCSESEQLCQYFLCLICFLRFDFKQSVEDHINNCHLSQSKNKENCQHEPSIYCTECQEKFNVFSLFEKHIRTHSKYFCPICSSTFIKKTQTFRHLIEIHNR